MKYEACINTKASKGFAASELTLCSLNDAQGHAASLSKSIIAKSFSATVWSHAAATKSWTTTNGMVDPFQNTSANYNLTPFGSAIELHTHQFHTRSKMRIRWAARLSSARQQFQALHISAVSKTDSFNPSHSGGVPCLHEHKQLADVRRKFVAFWVRQNHFPNLSYHTQSLLQYMFNSFDGRALQCRWSCIAEWPEIAGSKRSAGGVHGCKNKSGIWSQMFDMSWGLTLSRFMPASS